VNDDIFGYQGDEVEYITSPNTYTNLNLKFLEFSIEGYLHKAGGGEMFLSMFDQYQYSDFNDSNVWNAKFNNVNGWDTRTDSGIAGENKKYARQKGTPKRTFFGKSSSSVFEPLKSMYVSQRGVFTIHSPFSFRLNIAFVNADKNIIPDEDVVAVIFSLDKADDQGNQKWNVLQSIEGTEKFYTAPEPTTYLIKYYSEVGQPKPTPIPHMSASSMSDERIAYVEPGTPITHTWTVNEDPPEHRNYNVEDNIEFTLHKGCNMVQLTHPFLPEYNNTELVESVYYFDNDKKKYVSIEEHMSHWIFSKRTLYYMISTSESDITITAKVKGEDILGAALPAL